MKIIDPLVGPYSSVQEIEDWIAELKLQPKDPEVDSSIERAKYWLELKKKD